MGRPGAGGRSLGAETAAAGWHAANPPLNRNRRLGVAGGGQGWKLCPDPKARPAALRGGAAIGAATLSKCGRGSMALYIGGLLI